MPRPLELVVDAGIPIAKFRGEDPAFQQQHTDRFCELVDSQPIKVYIVERAFHEACEKYPHLRNSVEDYVRQLISQSKCQIVPKTFSAANARNILQLREDAKKRGFDLSFCDSTQAFYAKATKLALISWDGRLVDYSCEIGINAFRPNHFCDEYESKNSI